MIEILANIDCEKETCGNCGFDGCPFGDSPVGDDAKTCHRLPECIEAERKAEALREVLKAAKNLDLFFSLSTLRDAIKSFYRRNKT